MELAITKGGTVEKWVLVEPPAPGEFVALHLIPKRKAPERAIFVGREPWGRRGAKSGEAVDGRIVARTADLSDPEFNVLLFELLQNAVNANPPDSPVVPYCGEAALKLKDAGFRPSEGKVVCPRCGNGTERLQAAERFGRKTVFRWFTKPDQSDPRKMSSEVCLFCLRAIRASLEKQKDATQKKFREATVDDLVLAEATLDQYLPLHAFDDAMEWVDERIALANGR